MIKRAFDIIISAVALIVLSPFLLLIMLLLRFTGEGEVFFTQERIGYKNKPFNITKFATMLKSAADMKRGDFTVQDDPRVLPLGKFLRKFKVNELLQLWDVLRGKMSLVGPRPQLTGVHRLYPDEYAAVLDRVRPGITGIGSIIFRDEERIVTNAEDKNFCFYNQIIPYKFELEYWYSNQTSFWIDLKILAFTIWHIVYPRSKLVWKILPMYLHKDIDKFDGILDQ